MAVRRHSAPPSQRRSVAASQRQRSSGAPSFRDPVAASQRRVVVPSLVSLRARWYNPTSGVFLSRDPFGGFATRPYSLHPYQYGYANPVVWTDASGACIDERVPGVGEPGCRVEEGVLKGQLDWAAGAIYTADVVQGMGLPGAMIVDMLAGTDGTQHIVQHAGPGTYLGMAILGLASWTGGHALRAGLLKWRFVLGVVGGATTGSGVDYATQVAHNIHAGKTGRDAWIESIDGRKVAWWTLPGAAAGWGLMMSPYAAALYGGTNAAGNYFYSTVGGFDWDAFRVALATGMFGGGLAPWMAQTQWGAGLHGGLLNVIQYGLQQSLVCEQPEWINMLLALSTGFGAGYFGGAYTPLRKSVDPVLPLRYDNSADAQHARQVASILLQDQMKDNVAVGFASFIRGTMGATITNTNFAPVALWLRHLFARNMHPQRREQGMD